MVYDENDVCVCVCMWLVALCMDFAFPRKTALFSSRTERASSHKSILLGFVKGAAVANQQVGVIKGDSKGFFIRSKSLWLFRLVGVIYLFAPK